MPLQIPKPYVPAIVKIAGLPDGAVEELATALATAPVARQAPQAAAQIAERVPGVPLEDLAEIIEAVHALYRVREFMEITAGQFPADLVESLRSAGEAGIGIEDDARVRGVFARLLGIESLRSAAKGLKLQRDGERLYCEAKILTDIRPVFGADIAAHPQSAVITHTLKLSYHEGSEDNDFFVVLDGEDLEALKGVIERAQGKSATLRSMMNRLDLLDVGA